MDLITPCVERRQRSDCFRIGLLLSVVVAISAFQRVAFVTRRRVFHGRLYSARGDDAGLPPPPDDGSREGLFGDFLNPRQESENLRRAREELSEQSLPLSFDGSLEKDSQQSPDQRSDKDESSSSLVGPTGRTAGGGMFLDGPSAEALANNPYMQVVSKISPSELIRKFTTTASPRVQDAVRNTVLGLIGSLPKMAFDTTTITTGARLASLMFQLQVSSKVKDLHCSK
jgi:Protein of unknown function (DUF760)